jgi:hypothetical protein
MPQGKLGRKMGHGWGEEGNQTAGLNNEEWGIKSVSLPTPRKQLRLWGGLPSSPYRRLNWWPSGHWASPSVPQTTQRCIACHDRGWKFQLIFHSRWQLLTRTLGESTVRWCIQLHSPSMVSIDDSCMYHTAVRQLTPHLREICGVKKVVGLHILDRDTRRWVRNSANQPSRIRSEPTERCALTPWLTFSRTPHIHKLASIHILAM